MLNFASSFFFNPVSPPEIEFEIMTTPINKAYGLYSFPPHILRSAKHNIISQPLSLFINKSLENSVYPSKLKLAKVIPIYKSNDESAPSNYRPISLLSVFNNIIVFLKKWCITILNLFLCNIISFMIHNMVFMKKDPVNMLFKWT